MIRCQCAVNAAAAQAAGRRLNFDSMFVFCSPE
jgi:hypothetical protein